MRRLLLGVIVLACIAARAEATVFFDESFESAVVPLDPNANSYSGTGKSFQGAPAGWFLWRSRDPNNNMTINGQPYAPNIDGCTFTRERAHTGTISIKFDYNILDPVLASSDCYVAKGNDVSTPSVGNLPHPQDLWIRFWMLLVNYDGSNVNTKLIYLKMFPDNYPDMVVKFFGPASPSVAPQNGQDCWNYPNPGMNFDCWTSSNFIANLGQPAFSNNVWHCVEYHLKLNDNGVRNAVFESWVDNVQHMSFSGFSMRGPRAGANNPPSAPVNNGSVLFNQFALYHQGSNLGSIMYWDDVATGDQRIGCGPSTTTTPNAPAVLQLSSVVPPALALALLAFWLMRRRQSN